MNKYKEIYEAVSKFINPVYLVGGPVRDMLLNSEPNDYDFCTPLDPDTVEKLVKADGRRAYCVGKKFGTIGFKLDGNFIEVTTFRQEKYKPRNRRPDVEFVKSINEDLARRDFTINAMAWRNRKIIDPFNGREDLANGIIRSVGLAQTRIKEDPLRMLRAARFMSKFNFDIDEELKKQIKKNAYKILHVSKERWMMELDKLLLSDYPALGLDLLMESRLLNFMIPELSLQYEYDQNSPWHEFDLWTHTTKVVTATPKDINLRWAALLHDVAKPFVRTDKEDRSNYIFHDYLGADMVIKIANHLKWSNDLKNNVHELVVNHLNESCPLKQYDDISKSSFARGGVVTGIISAEDLDKIIEKNNRDFQR